MKLPAENLLTFESSYEPAHERGNALFIILIAVVLFAALGFAVSQIMHSGNPNAVTEEKAGLFADDILNYARSLRQGVQNLKISNGCNDMDISFENLIVSGYEHNPVARDACMLFGTKGGGLAYMPANPEWLDMQINPAPALRGQWFFPAKVCAAGLGCESDGLDNEALVAFVPYIRKPVCLKINDSLGVVNPGGNPPVENGNAWPNAGDKFVGVESDGERLDQADGAVMGGCFEGAGVPSPGTYTFFQVLLPR